MCKFKRFITVVTPMLEDNKYKQTWMCKLLCIAIFVHGSDDVEYISGLMRAFIQEGGLQRAPPFFLAMVL